MKQKITLLAMFLVTINSFAANFYWVNGSGNWSDYNNHWATTSGGVTFQTQVPQLTDNVYFDALSFNTLGQTVTVDQATVQCADMDWTGVLNNPVLFGDSTNTLKIYGSLTLYAGMNFNLNGQVSMEAITPKTITSGNVIINASLAFNCMGGGYALLDVLRVTKSIYLNSGTLNTNNQDVQTLALYSTTTSARALNMGSSNFSLLDNNGVLWSVSPSGMTLNAGSSTIYATCIGTGGSFYGGGFTYNNLNFTGNATGYIYDNNIIHDVSFAGNGNISGGSFHDVSFAANATINGPSAFNNVTIGQHGIIWGSNTFTNLTFSPGYSYTLQAGQTQSVAGNICAQGTGALPIRIQSNSLGMPATIIKPTGTMCWDYVHVSDITATGGAVFNAGLAPAMSQDLGGNTGLLFTGGCTFVSCISSPLPSSCTSPIITNQPMSMSACSGIVVPFSIMISGTNLTYQWQVNEGTGFTNLISAPPYTGVTQSILNISGVTLAMNSFQYRCVVKSDTCSSTSNAATLTVTNCTPCTPPIITLNPISSNVCSGNIAIFSMAANDINFTYQYQWQLNQGMGFINIISAPPYMSVTQPILNITGVTTIMNGYQYRCVVSSGTCMSMSGPATLTVTNCGPCTAPIITNQPIPSSVCAGSMVNFFISSDAVNGLYQWQVNQGAGYTDLSNMPPYMGVTQPMLNIMGVTPAMNGFQYRCVVKSDTCSSTSNAATLTVKPSPIVTVNSPTICSGQTATLTATGATSYFWPNPIPFPPPFPPLPPSGDSSNPKTVSPILTTTYTVIGTTNSCSGTAIASVTVNPVPVVSVNSVTINSGQTATLIASGATTYNWSTGETSNSISVSPATTTFYTVTGTSNNCSSNAIATVTVNSLSSLTITPVGPYNISDLPITLSASIAGGLWSGIGITDPINGVFSPAIAGPGRHTISYFLSGPFGDTATTEIVVKMLIDGISLPTHVDTTGNASIFDRFGNSYTYDEIRVGGINQHTPGQRSCTAGYFNLDFVGDGFVTNQNSQHTDMENLLCQVFTDLSALITPSQCNGVNPIINIRVVAPSNISANALGAATPYYTPACPNDNTGVIDCDIWKAINSGVNDPNLYDGEIQVQFNPLNFPWNFNTACTTCNNQYDAYSVYLHEAIHCLGFASLIDANGLSLAPGSNHFSRFDTHLQDNEPPFNGAPFINWDGCYNSTFGLNTNAITDFNCNHVTFNGINSLSQPIYAPNVYILGSSLSHFSDFCSPSPGLNYVMDPSLAPGDFHRIPTPEEVNALRDLGYHTTGTFGIPAVTTTLPIGGEIVAGVDDGFNSNCSTPLTVCVNATITVSPLDNDIGVGVNGALGTMDCLQITCGSGSFTTNLNSFTFTPGSVGITTLTYIPVNSGGQRGNITSIRIVISACGATCATPLNCNQVCNPDFAEPLNCNPTPGSSCEYCPFCIGGIPGGWIQSHGTPQLFGQAAYMAVGTTSGIQSNEGIITPINVLSNTRYTFSYRRRREASTQQNSIDNIFVYLLNQNQLGTSVIPAVPGDFAIPSVPTNYNFEILHETSLISTTMEQVTVCFTTPNDGRTYDWLWIYPQQNGINSFAALHVDWVQLMEDNFTAGNDQTVTCGEVVVGSILCAVNNVTQQWTWGNNQSSNIDQLTFANTNPISPSTNFTLTRTFPANPPQVTNTCPTTDNVTVTVNSPLQLTVTTGLCGNASVAVTGGTAPYTYEWKDINGTTLISQSVTGLATGTYTVSVSDANGCANLTIATIVNQAITVTVNPQIICPNATATLTAIPSVGGGTYLWNTGDITPSINVTPTVNTTYVVTYTLGGCLSSPTSVNVTVTDLAMTSEATATICSGGTVSIPLTSNMSSTYTWIATDNPNTTGESLTNQTTNTLSNTITSNSNIVQTVTYTVTPIHTNGICIGTPQTITVTIIPAPVITSSTSATICNGGTVNIPLTSDINSTYTWIAADNPNVFQESTTQQTSSSLNNTLISNTISSQTVTYTVTPTSSQAGCPGIPAIVTVTISPTPIMTNTNSATICNGGVINIPLTSSVTSTYTWIATNNVNTSGESTTLQTGSPLLNTIANNTLSDQTITYLVSPTSSPEGCTGIQQNITVIVHPIPTMTNTNTTICSGGTMSIPLTSNISSTYTWIATDNPNTTGESLTTQSTNILNNTITNNSTTAQTVTYTLTPTSTGPPYCSGTSQIITVTVNPLPIVTVNSVSICTGSTATLNANGATTYSWSTGATTNSISVSPTINTTYTVTGTNANSCSNTAIATVTVNPIPTASILYSGTPFCKSLSVAQQVTLSSTAGGTFSSIPSGLTINGNTGAIYPSTSTIGTYTVTYTIPASGSCPQVIATTTVNIVQCCTSTANPPITVPYGGALSTSFGGSFPVTPGTIAINGNFTIPIGASFQINTRTLLFAPNVKIIILSGATLTIIQSTLYSCGNMMWDGIEIQSGGKLILSEGTRIEDAKIAVYSDNSSSVANFNISGTTFNRNYIGIKVSNYTLGTLHPGIIVNCTFDSQPFSATGNVSTLDSPYSAQTAETGVELDNVNYISIGDATSGKNHFIYLRTGIRAKNSGYYVYHNEFIDNFHPQLCVNCPVTGWAIWNTNTGCIVGGTNSQSNNFQNLSCGILHETGWYLNVQNNTFTNITNNNTGIHSVAINTKGFVYNGIGLAPTINIQDNIFNKMETGLSHKNNTGTSYNVSGNTFKDFSTFGIEAVQNTRGSINIGGLNAFKNTFKQLNNSTYTSDIAISVSNAVLPLSSSYTYVNIINNIINTKVSKGILLTKIKAPQVLSNLIELKTTNAPSPSAAYYGIKAMQCSSEFINLNQITRGNPKPSSSFENNVYGITVESSTGATTVSENTTINLGTGLRFRTYNLGSSTVKCNIMTNNWSGLTIDNSNIGPQGKPVSGTYPLGIASDNKWSTIPNSMNGSFSVHGKIPYTQVLFYTRSASPPWCPVGSNISPNQTIITTANGGGTTLLVNLATQSCANICYNPPFCPKHAILAQIARNQPPFNLVAGTSRFTMQEAVLRGVLADSIPPDITTTDGHDLQAFIDTTLTNTNVGKLITVSNLYASGDTNAAIALNSSIVPIECADEYHQTVNTIFFNTWSLGVFYFSIADSITLYNIAIQDPLLCGTAIYDARVMLGIDINDFSMDGNKMLEIPGEEGVITDKVGILYPNPAQNKCTYEATLSEMESGMVTMCDLNGKLLSSYKLNSGYNNIDIDLSILSNGIYLYKIYINGDLQDYKKLVITK